MAAGSRGMPKADDYRAAVVDSVESASFPRAYASGTGVGEGSTAAGSVSFVEEPFEPLVNLDMGRRAHPLSVPELPKIRNILSAEYLELFAEMEARVNAFQFEEALERIDPLVEVAGLKNCVIK